MQDDVDFQTIDDAPIGREVEVQALPYFPIYIADLFSSVFFCESTDAEYRAGTTLWYKSWHERPAGSLPNNDNILASMAGFGRDVEGWLKVKKMALLGYKLCKDGRLYHPKIVDRAVELYERHKSKSYTNSKNAKKRWSKDSDQLEMNIEGDTIADAAADALALRPHDDVDATALPNKINEINKKNNETNNSSGALSAPICGGGGGGKKKKKLEFTIDSRIWFNRFWNRYPSKVGKLDAQASFLKMLDVGITIEIIMEGLERYIKTKPADRPYCNPATWLNQGRWEDQIAGGENANAKPLELEADKKTFPLPVHGELVTPAMCPAPVMEQHIGKIFVLHDSQEWGAWIFYLNDTARKMNKPAPIISALVGAKAGRGWAFPTRWPPGHPGSKV